LTAIIIDGISASGKSILLQGLRLISEERATNFTKLFLTEHLTERFFEKEMPLRSGIHEHVARILRLVGEIQSMQAASPFADNKKILTITIERLFLTLLSRGLMTTDFFSEEAELVKKTDLKNIFLVVPKALIGERIAQSLIHRNQGWRDYIGRLGGLSGAISHFQAQQDTMWRANEALSKHISTEAIEVADLADLSDKNFLEGILWPNILAS
jgi:hypothetical protein